LILTIDTRRGTLNVADGSDARDLPLYSKEAFEAISEQWVRVGWALGQYFTFSWMGLPILQLPEDLLRVQEVIGELQPDAIVETGIFGGGSMLFLASVCESLGKGRIVGIDKHIPAETREGVTRHRLSHRVTLIEGDSAAPDVVAQVRHAIAGARTVMVLLDSDHSKAHVARELEAYAPMVTPGSCIVAADGIMSSLADVPGGDPSWTYDNPSEAAREFAAGHPEFELRPPVWRFNRSRLDRAITYWPDGWLWRRA
jgi:cephalosporin hydroxylase